MKVSRRKTPENREVIKYAVNRIEGFERFKRFYLLQLTSKKYADFIKNRIATFEACLLTTEVFASALVKCLCLSFLQLFIIYV